MDSEKSYTDPARPWLDDGSWRSDSIKAVEQLLGRGEQASAVWRLICERTADYLARRGDTGRSWLGRFESHGVTIDVDGDHVRIGDDESGYVPIVFDEAMDIAAALELAVRQAIRNAVKAAG